MSFRISLALIALLSFSVYASSECEPQIRKEIFDTYGTDETSFMSSSINDLEDQRALQPEGTEYLFKVVSFFHDSEIKIFLVALEENGVNCLIHTISEVISHDQ